MSRILLAAKQIEPILRMSKPLFEGSSFQVMQLALGQEKELNAFNGYYNYATQRGKKTQELPMTFLNNSL